ncbi:MAG: hypothetical protein NVSMB9_34970 [Isosphaeraceae bacterium]
MVRFVVHQKIAGESRQAGLFAAAYFLLDEGDLTRHDRERLNELLVWFRTELTVPPDGLIPDGAIFWYKNVGPFSQQMWALAHALDDCGFTTELITGQFVGRIVYQDEHQLAALPPTRRHR